MRGIVNAVLLVTPVWVLVVVTVHRPPQSFTEVIVYALLTAMGIYCVRPFLRRRPVKRNPPCPDMYFNALSPISDERQTRWEDTH